jgi:hypothetical protein
MQPCDGRSRHAGCGYTPANWSNGLSKRTHLPPLDIEIPHGLIEPLPGSADKIFWRDDDLIHNDIGRARCGRVGDFDGLRVERKVLRGALDEEHAEAMLICLAQGGEVICHAAAGDPLLHARDLLEQIFRKEESKQTPPGEMGRISSVATHPPVPILVHSCFGMDRIHVRASIRLRNSEGKPLVTENARFCEIFNQIFGAIFDDWHHSDRSDHDQAAYFSNEEAASDTCGMPSHSGG